MTKPYIVYFYKTKPFWKKKKKSPVCQDGALNCGKRVVPEEAAWAVRDSTVERKFITEDSLVLVLALFTLVSNIPERPTFEDKI